MRPPGLEAVESFDELPAWTQAKMIAFTHIIEYQEADRYEMLAKIMAKVPF